MTVRKLNKIQSPMIFEATFGPEDVGNTIEVDVPPNFVLLDAAVSVREVFDGTTPTIGVTDNKTSPTVIIADTTVLTAVADVEATAARFTTYPSGGTIIVAPIGAGVTTGAGAVILRGYVEGRQNERYGT